jgi:hypothetical protein
MSYVYFEPISWSQHISYYQDHQYDRRGLNAKCKPAQNCDLLLGGKKDVREIDLFHLGIIDGKCQRKNLKKPGFYNRPLGDLVCRRSFSRIFLFEVELL